jgi:hypothetical protein
MAARAHRAQIVGRSYTRLAQEIAFEVTEVDEAAAEVRAFIAEIADAGRPEEPPSA